MLDPRPRSWSLDSIERKFGKQSQKFVRANSRVLAICFVASFTIISLFYLTQVTSSDSPSRTVSRSLFVERKLKILLIIETMNHVHVPRHHFQANLAISLANKGHHVRVLPIENCAVPSIADRLKEAGVSVLACPCQHERPSRHLGQQELFCCGFCGLHRIKCLSESDRVLNPSERVGFFGPGEVDVVIIAHGGGMERTLPHHLSWYLLRRFKSIDPPPKVVFLTDDILSIRREMFLTQIENPWQLEDYQNHLQATPAIHLDLTRRMEFTQLLKVDAVWTVSNRDQVLLQQIGVKNVGLIRFVANLNAPEVVTPFHQRKNLLFTGWGWTESSRFGLRFFIEHVFHIILAEVPDMRLMVVGHDWEPERGRLQRELQGKAMVSLNNIDWLGIASDARLEQLYASAKLFISPVIAQTGVASKVFSALLRALPVVTTTSGTGGLMLSCDSPLVAVHDQPAEFAAAVLMHYLDKELWEAVSMASISYMTSNFNLNMLGQDLSRGLNQLPSTQSHTLPRTVESQMLKPSEVFACSDSEYGGFCEDVSNSRKGEFGTDVSSIAIATGLLVVLYDAPKQQGHCLVLWGSERYLEDWNDRPMSYHIFAPSDIPNLGESVVLSACQGTKQDDFKPDITTYTCRDYSF